MTDTPPPQIDMAAMAAAAAEAMKPKICRTTENFWDQDGMRIEWHTFVRGERPADFPEFVAHGAIEIEVPFAKDPTTGKILTRPERRPLIAPLLNAKNLDEALAQGQEELAKAAEKFKKGFEEAKAKALKEAQDSVAAQNTRKMLTQGLPQG